MELVSVKILVLTISGAIRIIFGLFPMIIFRGLLRGKEKKAIINKVISYLMFLGGGVLLATCIVHMMPEVREKFQTANLDTKLPVAEIVFISGFFIIYLLEDIIHGFVERRRSHKRKQRELSDSPNSSTASAPPPDLGVQNHGFSYQITPPSSVSAKQMFGQHLSRNEIPGLTPIPRARSDNGKLGIATIDPKFTYVDGDWWRDTVNTNSQINLLNSNQALGARSTSLYDIPLNGSPTKINNQFGDSSSNGKNGWVSSVDSGHGDDQDSSNDSHDHSQGHGHSHSHVHLPPPGMDDSVGATFRNLLLVCAMSFHGIFEGMAIGLQEKEENVWYFFLAVSLHECVIIFCIGVELISSKTKVLRMITYILVVSLVCPIGIAIGIVVSESDLDNNALIIGSLQGLAAGTLLYVTFFEIFAEQGRHLQNKYLHILVAVIGFKLMVALEFVGGHSHGGGSHGHGHSHGHGSDDKSVNSSSIIDDHHDHDHGHAPRGHHHDDHAHDHDHGHDHTH